MRSTPSSRVALTIVVALTLSSAAAQAQGAPPNLTGTWRFNVTTDAGTGTPTVTLKQQGDSLSGSYSSQVFGEQPVRGSVKDRDFNFAFTATIEGNTFTVTYRGTITSADSLKGQISLGDAASGTFTAVRQPPTEAQANPARAGRVIAARSRRACPANG
jgi:hypothetical protein